MVHIFLESTDFAGVYVSVSVSISGNGMMCTPIISSFLSVVLLYSSGQTGWACICVCFSKVFVCVPFSPTLFLAKLKPANQNVRSALLP